jgi:DNA-binding transcriptional LysR family regulator
MEFHRMRSLVILADQLHFGRAAGILHLSQPALSKQIRLLEEEIGGTLFLRGRQGAELTALGKVVVAEARAVVKASENFASVCRHAASGEVGTLDIGFGFTALEIVPAAVAAFRCHRPNVVIRLSDISTAEQVEALHSGRIQLGVVRMPVAREFAQEALLEDSLALVVPEATWRPRCSLKSFRDAPFILLARDRAPGFHGHVLRLCARSGFSPRVVQETNEFHTVLAFVAAGVGVGFVSKSFMNARPAPVGVRTVELLDSAARWTVGAAWRKQERNPLVDRFVQTLQEQMRLR